MEQEILYLPGKILISYLPSLSAIVNLFSAAIPMVACAAGRPRSSVTMPFSVIACADNPEPDIIKPKIEHNTHKAVLP
jgi:hypothetical protein